MIKIANMVNFILFYHNKKKVTDISSVLPPYNCHKTKGLVKNTIFLLDWSIQRTDAGKKKKLHILQEYAKQKEKEII